jgi:endonuclease/exonuclease/phosphatase family metal-dependent hydrolase
MTDTTRTKRVLTTLGAAAAALSLTATLASAPATARPSPEHKSPPGAAHAAAPARTAEVMTRNLYLGADLLPVVAVLLDPDADQLDLAKAATATWANVQATRPAERMAAIAEEITEERPAVVGLQEVTRWTTYDGTLAGTVRYDFLALLLEALERQGADYRVVEGATADNFRSGLIPLLPSAGAAAVSMTDRDVILVRDDVKTHNAQHGNFTNIIEQPLRVDRGWGSVDVRTRLARFRFVNAHLEAFSFPGSAITAEQLRVLQVGELLAAQEAIADEHGELPMVYVGDYNSDAPDGAAYDALVEGVGTDAWLEAEDDRPGFTCCFDEFVTDEDAELDSRIDLVVIDEHIEARDAEVIGDKPSDMTRSGLWPSDHAGVVAELVVGPGKR